jgi:hypothetical protein
MWIVGGDANQGHYQTDVWSSADGANWQLEAKEVPWGPRVLYQTLVFDNKIWVMGGQTLPTFTNEPLDVYYSDVWNSEDGLHWERVTENVPWSPRGIIGGTVVFKERMWIIGGGTYSTPGKPMRVYYNDVWNSQNGVNWTCATEAAAWSPRQFHDVAVFDDRIWVLEGGDLAGNRKDVWHSSDGIAWEELPDTPWLPRHAASIFVFDDALWVVAGNNMTSDVWKLEKEEGS